MNRRDFLNAAVCATAATLATPAWAQAPVRKSFTDLPNNAPEIKAYRDAVAKMKALPASNPRSWAAQAAIHNNFCPHQNWWFLPWHRAYLFYFEQVCREVLAQPNFRLPYWDWTKFPKIPPPFLDTGSPLFQSGRSQNGNFTIPTDITGPAVIRSLMRSNSLTPLFSGGTTTDQQREASVTGELEGTPHNAVHGITGGIMATFNSPLDPIFWLHHCNIDRIWVSWAAQHNNRVPTQNRWKNHKLTQFFDTVTKGTVSPTTLDMRNAAALNAVYDRLEPGGAGRQVISSVMDTVLGRNGAATDAGRTPASVQAPGKPAKLGEVVKFSLAPTPQIRKVITDSTSGRGAAGEVYLLIEDVPPPKTPATAMRVFVNSPNPSPTPSPEAPGYVRTVAFFDDPAHAAHSPAGRSFAIQISDALASSASRGANAAIDVALVPVDLSNPGRRDESEVLRPKNLRLVALDS